MSERVLNFSEFFTKYSKEGQDDKVSLDNLTGAAANFEEGFDKDTYDQAPLGPKKPVASAQDATPPQPGEQGAPAFSAETEEDMVAPEEIADEETAEETEETEETPEPEAGANPKDEEKVEEGLVRSFSSFINESEHTEEMGTYPEDDDFLEDLEGARYEEEYPEEMMDDDDLFGTNPSEDEDLLGANPFGDEEMVGDADVEFAPGEEPSEFGANPFAEDEYEYCDDCGEPIYHTVEGASCGCNM